jgi:hypothetical protein
VVFHVASRVSCVHRDRAVAHRWGGGGVAAELPITLSSKLLPEMEREEAQLLKQFLATVVGEPVMQQFEKLQVPRPFPPVKSHLRTNKSREVKKLYKLLFNRMSERETVVELPVAAD